MKKQGLIFLVFLFTLTAKAQMPTVTFDATQAVNAGKMIASATTTIEKLNKLKEISKKTLEVISTVSDAITTSRQVMNTLEYQKKIIEGLGKINSRMSDIRNPRLRRAYLNMTDQVLDATNSTVKTVNKIISTGTFKMNDYERLQLLAELENDMQNSYLTVQTLLRKTRR